jgi:quinol monooxygenase YgiN
MTNIGADSDVDTRKVDCMPTVIGILKVKEGKMNEALKVLREIVPQIRKAEPGIVAYIPHTIEGIKEKNSILFYEKYKDNTALQTHMANLGKSLAKLMPLLDSGMDTKLCNEII